MKRFFVAGALFLFFGFTLYGVTSPLVVSAAPNEVTFIDKTTVIYQGKTYKDQNPWDNTTSAGGDGWGNYTLEGRQGDCIDNIDIDNFNSSKPSAKFNMKTEGSSGSCKEDSKSVPINSGSLSRKLVNGYRLDDDTVWLPVGTKDPGCIDLNSNDNAWFDYNKPKYYVRQPKEFKGRPNPDFKQNQYDQNPMPDEAYITIKMEGGGKGTLLGGGNCGSENDEIKIRYGVVLANNGEKTVPPAEYYGSNVDKNKPKPGEQGSADNDSKGGANDALQCDVELLNPLTWLMCPIITGAVEAIQQFDNAITQAMIVPTNKLFNTGAVVQGNASTETADAFYKAWSGFRYIALGLLVIVGLVMIISQAIGSGPFDAYTVKRTMPRLVAAIVLISLSWWLLKLAVVFSNDVGTGLRSIIYAPFSDFPAASIDNGGVALLSVAAGGALLGLGLVGILSFAVTALIAVIIAFVVITFRVMLIMLLVVIAPIAIVAWILPNTQRAWKMWGDYFLRALVVFPIIVLFISIGRVFAVIAKEIDNGLLGSLIAFIAYFGPYFLIPTAFKMAGGAIATVSGALNKASSPLQQGLSGFRKRQAATKWQDTLAGNRFKGNNAFSRRASTVLGGAALIGTGKAGANPLRMRGRLAAAHGTESLHQAKELMEKNEDMKAVMADDHLLQATLHGRNRGDIERHLLASGRFGQAGSASLAAAVSSVEKAQRSGSANAVGIAATMGLAATGTGYDTHADMYRGIMAAGHGNQALENAMLGEMRGMSERARRPDLATAGHVQQMQALNALREGAADEEIDRAMITQAFATGGAYAMVSGRNNGFQPIAQQLGDDFDAAMAAGDLDAATEAASRITSLRGAMGNASPENRQAISALLDHVGVDLAAVGDNGQSISTDEQLGARLAEQFATPAGIPPTDQAARDATTVFAQQATQAIRTRAGLYDVGGGSNLTPGQIEARRQNDPNNPQNNPQNQ